MKDLVAKFLTTLANGARYQSVSFVEYSYVIGEDKVYVTHDVKYQMTVTYKFNSPHRETKLFDVDYSDRALTINERI